MSLAFLSLCCLLSMAFNSCQLLLCDLSAYSSVSVCAVGDKHDACTGEFYALLTW